MGITSSKNNTESLNWDNINTESMSSTVPNLKYINEDAKILVSNLTNDENFNLENTESDNENMFTWIRKLGDEPNNKPVEKVEQASEEFSDTSPFISSEMYNYLMNNNNNSSDTSVQKVEQQGGAKNSSTSSTSSSAKKSTKKSNKKNKYTESSSTLSGGDLSYISSSAHTDHSESNQSEESISIQNNNMLSSDVHTSEINMVEDDVVSSE